MDTRVMKRLLDIGLAGTGLLCSSPLWLVLAGLIRLEDGGPVFYSQERVGQSGRTFRVWKFRSMVPDAEKYVGAVQAAENDPRVTRVGRLMRATAMDELPQLWNILIGDMSFVGPRALRPGEIEVLGDGALEALEDVPGYAERCLLRPGLTGIAQIYGATSSATTVSTCPDRASGSMSASSCCRSGSRFAAAGRRARASCKRAVGRSRRLRYSYPSIPMSSPVRGQTLSSRHA
jgi:lipopolysaccharide/colanic/teichoic acid biosynthesis glycosyltransferase